MAKKLAILLVGLIPSAFLAWRARDMPHLGHYHDDGIYWVTAKSLAEGHGYRILSLPDQPYQTKYPPLYPTLLAGVWKLWPAFPASLRPALLLNWLVLPLYLLLARRALEDVGVSGIEGWILCAVVAASPIVALLSVTLLSDLVFGCLLLGSFALATRSARPGSAWWMAAAAGLLGGAAYLTRVAALPLLLAGPLWFLLRRQRAKALAFFAAMAPVVAGWGVWVRGHAAGSSDIVTLYYTNYLGYQFSGLSWRDLPMTVSKNLYCLLLAVSQLFVYNAGASFRGDFFWRLLAFAAVAGIVRLARRRGIALYDLFAAALAPLLLVCVWPPDGRALLPVFPWLLAGLATELRHIAGLLGAAWRRPDLASRTVAGVLAAGIATVAGMVAYSMGDGLFRFLPGLVDQHRQLLAADRDAYAWISRNLPGGSTFVAYDDTVLYLYTGRRASSIRIAPGLYYRGDSEAAPRAFCAVADFSQRHKLGYIFATAGDFSRGELAPDQRAAYRQQIERSPGWQLVYRNAMAAVYQAPGQPKPPGAATLPPPSTGAAAESPRVPEPPKENRPGGKNS